MSADLDQWAPHMTTDRAADIRFGKAEGNVMSSEWMAYAVGLWHAAGDKKFTFAEAVKQTAVHFMVGEQP